MTAVAGAPAADAMVLFDWNGTVVLDADRAREALAVALAVHGLPEVSAADFPTVFRLPMRDMFVGLGVDDSELEAAERDWNDHMATSRSVLRAGTASSLTALEAAGVWLGVVSAAAQEAVDFDLASLDVPRVFESVQAPVADKVAVLRSHRGRRARAFYVGDTAYDMHSAREAGYVPVAVRGGYAPEAVLVAAGAEHVIDALDELVGLVLGRGLVPAGPGPESAVRAAAVPVAVAGAAVPAAVAGAAVPGAAVPAASWSALAD